MNEITQCDANIKSKAQYLALRVKEMQFCFGLQSVDALSPRSYCRKVLRRAFSEPFLLASRPREYFPPKYIIAK